VTTQSRRRALKFDGRKAVIDDTSAGTGADSPTRADVRDREEIRHPWGGIDSFSVSSLRLAKKLGEVFGCGQRPR
jgi:hypothetical protein